jgi:glutaredoxin
MAKPIKSPPDALLLMGRQCPYCPTVLKGLQTLLQDHVIGKLETVVIEDHPDRATELGVRSVPWVRIGTFELTGLRSEQELREWAQQAGALQGTAKYLDELLSTGNIGKVLDAISAEPGTMQALLLLFADPDTELNTRIGISAVMESLEGGTELQTIEPELYELLRHTEARVRGDACYYLALGGNRGSLSRIEPLLQDPDHNVREIAHDTIARLTGSE